MIISSDQMRILRTPNANSGFPPDPFHSSPDWDVFMKSMRCALRHASLPRIEILFIVSVTANSNVC